MTDLTKFLEEGRLDIFIVVSLLLALVWVVKQWRLAEKDKDNLHEARLKDAKEMSVLATEVKNVISALIHTPER
jgi:hypothetical protein